MLLLVECKEILTSLDKEQLSRYFFVIITRAGWMMNIQLERETKRECIQSRTLLLLKLKEKTQKHNLLERHILLFSLKKTKSEALVNALPHPKSCCNHQA